MGYAVSSCWEGRCYDVDRRRAVYRACISTVGLLEYCCRITSSLVNDRSQKETNHVFVGEGSKE